MALVAYSDSEGSDAEPDTTPASSTANKAESGPGFQVDRSNPRKIRVALPEVKPEHAPDQDGEDGPARKKARVGGGGAFSGFNSFLPAPKKAEKKAPVATTRKVFSLKTGATPGFSREADAEMRNDFAFDADAGGDDADTIPAAGSLGSQTTSNDAPTTTTEIGEFKLQGNPMMFRPLSVGRNQKKKKSTKTTSQPIPSAPAPRGQGSEMAAPQPTTKAPAEPAPPKPKVSLFSLSSEDSSRTDDLPASAGTYEPLVYETETPSAGPAPAPELASAVPDYSKTTTVSSNPSSLDNIANDLNLSKSERRQLFGRNAPPAESRILEFNTDKEYATNQALAQTELAATQHNPVRAIAPGKHTLQQLVNAASSQKDALEESFAAGRRNKKEAGSKYGW
ncbi:uncharacterized protein N7498_002036 [Penicillium cinerascens]|uniref:Mitotic checkpoint regulator, MAD2B-interacting-domain-containing protein n=1 Tax=Penicillium cinerascens TaxID=70096 RepID=A0A9W9TAV1_9EURO|nr:uncharacterized protein N7498_002036 [Penicillium cinerascens]KAJ5215629.1 hypothetical protein N7498_002036 [Penicillium cinerascens]